MRNGTRTALLLVIVSSCVAGRAACATATGLIAVAQARSPRGARPMMMIRTAPVLCVSNTCAGGSKIRRYRFR